MPTLDTYNLSIIWIWKYLTVTWEKLLSYVNATAKKSDKFVQDAPPKFLQAVVESMELGKMFAVFRE